MDELRDIYKKPDEPGQGPKPMPMYDVTTQEVRRRTIRQVVSLTVIMALILGVSVGYFYFQESQLKTDDVDIALTVPVPTNLPRAPIDRRPVPTETALPQELTDREPGGMTDVSPQRMTEAMGLVRIASEFLDARELDKAEETARDALEVWPDMNAALRLLGVIYTQRGQFDQAIAILEEALRTDPFSAETFSNLATAYMQKRVYDKAEDLLLTSLQIRPGYAIANLNLGLLYLVWGRYAEAVEHFEDARAQMPDHPSLLNNLAVALIRTGRYEEARRHLARLIERSPEGAAPYFNMAITFALEKNSAEAIAWIRRGAAHCSPVVAQNYLRDTDFDDLRGLPEFQAFLAELARQFPDLPQGPGGT